MKGILTEIPYVGVFAGSSSTNYPIDGTFSPNLDI